MSLVSALRGKSGASGTNQRYLIIFSKSLLIRTCARIQNQETYRYFSIIEKRKSDRFALELFRGSPRRFPTLLTNGSRPNRSQHSINAEIIVISRTATSAEEEYREYNHAREIQERLSLHSYTVSEQNLS